MDSLSNKLREYANSGAYPFHMPGHKRQLDGAYLYDITEIDGFDNLNDPSGIIKEMNEEIAAEYGSKVSFFTVGGSTCGNLSAISTVADMGDTVIVARNCHKSVFNAVYLRKLNAEYVLPSMYNSLLIGEVTLQSVKAKVEELLSNSIRPKAVIITSPTYEGVVSDIKSISEYLHSEEIVLIVDSAHGAHLHLDGTFPRDQVGYADICIMSAHKSLPVLTGGAIVHVNSELIDEKNVFRYISMYQTSSPSYVIMESMSRALELMHEKARIEGYIANLRRFYAACKDLSHLSIEPISDKRDMGKIVIYTNGYMSGDELGRILREQYKLETEMCMSNYVLAMTSLMDTGSAFDRLSNAIIEIDGSINISSIEEMEAIPISEHTKKCEPYQVTGKCVNKPIDDCIGEVAFEAIVPYPPGIPLVMPGEVITKEDIEYIKKVDNLKELGCYIV